MFTLGALYRDGRQCEKNICKALDNYTRAAELNYIPACMRAAFLLMPDAKGIAPCGHPNPEQAIRFYEMAVDAGVVSAMHNLAVVLSGHMDPRRVNLKKAVELWKRAADAGLAAAQFRYGECAENGTGMAQNLDMAIAYYHLAGKQGHSKALAAVSRLQSGPS
jgi:TPR repeat protein